jgi:hypothetical protein
MGPVRRIVAFVFLLSAFAFSQHISKSSNVPEAFGDAHYVYVEATRCGSADPPLVEENFQAIADVQEALRRWNRYTLTKRREQADLVIVVCKIRPAGADAFPVTNSNSSPLGNPIPGVPPGTRGVRTPDDLFSVYLLCADGTLSDPMWLDGLAGGLDTPELRLFTQFKDAVERAYPSKPANQGPKP